MQGRIRQQRSERFAMTISCELRHIHPTRRTQLPLTFSCVLFGHLKNRLQGQEFGFANELLLGVRKLLGEISFDTLEAVLPESVNRLDRCTAALEQMESMWKEAKNGPLSDS
jgi:hypothetical protein